MSGIMLVDKPQGWTSHDVCQYVKKNFRVQKVGHGGTLEPFATGLLVLYIDESTKLAGQSLNHEKVYEGSLHLGVETSTGDPDGEIVSEGQVDQNLTPEAIQKVFDEFLGKGFQIPPMTSAVKQKGVPLYKLARKGKVVARESRPVEIFELKVLKFESPFVQFRTKVSKGTYIRVLAEQIGRRLGSGASLESLRRISSGPYHIENAKPVTGLTINDERLNTIRSL